MHRFRLTMMAMVVAALVAPLLAIDVAHASLDGPCQAQASISGKDGGTYESINPATKTGVYTVPIAGAANYSGSIAVTPPEEGRPISGWVSVALPLGSSLSLKTWQDEDATNTSDAGVITWDLPDAMPRGVEMTVSGAHSDLANCSGSLSVKLDGGITDSAAGMASLVLTAATLLGLMFAAFPKP